MQTQSIKHRNGTRKQDSEILQRWKHQLPIASKPSDQLNGVRWWASSFESSMVVEALIAYAVSETSRHRRNREHIIWVYDVHCTSFSRSIWWIFTILVFCYLILSLAFIAIVDKSVKNKLCGKFFRSALLYSQYNFFHEQFLVHSTLHV